ncbi:MAG TPA: AI-2E family transporter [Verrucomicrobiae bacterium]|jgi:predicted PurR-regulated permease PerM
MNTAPRSQLEHNLGWAVLILLLLGCLLVMRPFASALLWAIVLCFASWPLYERLVRWSGNRRALIASLMALGMFIVILLPFFIIGSSLVDNIRQFTGTVRGWLEQGPPEPPAWLAKIPVVGQRVMERWQVLAHDSAQLWTESRHLVELATSWLLKAGLGVGRGLLELALSIFIAFFLFRDGAVFALRLNKTVDRIGGERGRRLLTVAGNTIRGVVYGILGTSLVQAIAAGIGFLIAGVPDAGLLSLLTFFVSIVPVAGTGIVCLPVAIWLFYQGSTGWGIFMLIWGFGVGTLDNFVKPWLISQGSDMPFLLIFFGVIGGALTFGFIGVFLGPTLLAVGFRIAEEWTAIAHDTASVKENNGPGKKVVS